MCNLHISWEGSMDRSGLSIKLSAFTHLTNHSNDCGRTIWTPFQRAPLFLPKTFACWNGTPAYKHVLQDPTMNTAPVPHLALSAAFNLWHKPTNESIISNIRLYIQRTYFVSFIHISSFRFNLVKWDAEFFFFFCIQLLQCLKHEVNVGL